MKKDSVYLGPPTTESLECSNEKGGSLGKRNSKKKIEQYLNPWNHILFWPPAGCENCPVGLLSGFSLEVLS